MSKTQVKGADVKVKRSTSKVEDSPKLKKDDSKGKKDDPKVKKDDSKVKKDDSKVKKDDSKLKKDDSKSKKDDPKGKSETKLKESKSKEKTTPAPKLKSSGKSQTHLEEAESTKQPTEPQETVEPIALSPTHSEKHLELDKELHAYEGIEPEYVSGDVRDKRKRSTPGSDDAEKKTMKEKDATPKDRRSEEEHDMKKTSSRTKYDDEHMPEDTKRPRSRSQSKQDVKDKSGKLDDVDEGDYKKKKKTDSSDSSTKKDKQGRSKKPQNNETAESDFNKKEKYRQLERYCKKEKSWETRDPDDKKMDRWKTEDSDYNKEESRKTKDSDYKQARDWDTQDHQYEKPWQTKETDYRKNKADEHHTCGFKKKPWRPPCKSTQEQSWEEENDDYKNAYSYWKHRDRTDYSSSPYRKQEQSPKSYKSFDEDMSPTTIDRKFRSRIPTAQTERQTCNCQCTSCRPKYTERPACLCSKERQPEKYSQMSKEQDYRPQAKQAFQYAEKPERKTCCAMHSAVLPTKTCNRVPPFGHRPRPFQDPQSCCPKKCCGHNACSISRNRMLPCANAGYLSCAQQSQFYRAPVRSVERTCYAPPSQMDCLPRRLSCTISRPKSCPAKANDFRSNRSEQTRTCQQTCEYTPDRCTYTISPGSASPSGPNYSGGSSWDRMQPRRPVVSRNFSLSPQPKSCMDFARTMSDVCGCSRSLSQQLLTSPNKADSLSNTMSLKSELALRSKPKQRSFGEVRAPTLPSNCFSCLQRSRVSSNTVSKSDQVSGSVAMQSGSSALKKKDNLISTSQSYHSKLNSRTRDFKSSSSPDERDRVPQSHSYHFKRYSSFNRDSRDNGFEVGASNRSLTDRDFYSTLASHSDLKSTSSNSPIGSYGI